MKRPVLVALADACGVSIEWLATGRGQMARAAISVEKQDEPADTRVLKMPMSVPRDSDAEIPRHTVQSQSQSHSSLREHQESIRPPYLIDTVSLAKAIEIARIVHPETALSGSAETIADRLTAIYNVLIGSKS